ncbi:MAG: biotin transporter BioY [Deltaproteobacteria bacterium]|jgi:biotin transport system substrate-specific component|nr:biotin transporter BioY [Deltaproteobacteria bacterium]
MADAINRAGSLQNAPPSLIRLHRLVWIALMAALTGVGGLLAIPINPFSPAPITLQTMFVLLAGLILGSRAAAWAMLLYLLAGILGLPVFAGGRAGLAVFFGPTGGFLLGFVPAAMFCGLAKKEPVRSFLSVMGFCLVATAITLALGSIQLCLVLKISFVKALLVGVVPFLPGGLLKCLAAVSIYRFLAINKLLRL